MSTLNIILRRLTTILHKHILTVVSVVGLILLLFIVGLVAKISSFLGEYQSNERARNHQIMKLIEDVDAIELSLESQDVSVDSSCSCTVESLENSLDTPGSEGDEDNNWEEGDICDLPDINASIKLFTDYRAYDIWYTPHYRLQQVATTDENGFRRYNDDYLVALGSYYSTRIGDRFLVVLDTGNVFTVMLADGKQDKDCVDNMYTPCEDYSGNAAANVLEFIVDSDVLDASVYDSGDVNNISSVYGDIAMIKYLGRDDSADWDTYETVD